MAPFESRAIQGLKIDSNTVWQIGYEQVIACRLMKSPEIIFKL